MAERQVLFDAVFVCGMDGSAAAQGTPAFWVFGLHQMPPARALAQDLAAGRNLETLGRRFLSLNAFWTSHSESAFSQKERAI